MKKRLRLIITAFSISFAMMAALSLFAIRQFSSLIEYSNQVDHTNHVITQLYQIETLIKEMDIKECDFMITNDSSFLGDLFVADNNILRQTEALYRSLNNDKIQMNVLANLRFTIVQRRDNIRDNLKYIDTTQLRTASPFFYKGKIFKESAIQDLQKMRKRENETLREKFRTKMYYQQITYNTIQYLLSIFSIITIILFILMIKELKRRISFQDELQNKIADLKRSHDELEQIAYAVSHDLQEPLRKIQIFSNRLLYVKKDAIDEESKNTLERINNSAGRMHNLIGDLMNLTSLVKEENKDEVNLNNILRIVLNDLDQIIEERKAIIQIEALPEVTGHPRQLQLLFRSLLDNSLKFSKENETPVISIRYDRVSGEELKELNRALDKEHFNRVTIADNGIGFENKFINKMFQIFQSLHNKESEYAGKGIGLAICQRVMVNHGGYILAHGHQGVGATFKLYFPAK